MIIDKKKKTEEQKVLEIINKGGYVTADIKKPKNKDKIFSLRMPEKMFMEIDKVLLDKVGISKTGWILQCIDEKLKQG